MRQRRIITAIVALLAFLIVCFGIVQLAHATTVTPIFGGGSGTSTAPTIGKVLVGDANGNYEFAATSTFGTGGNSFTYPFGTATNFGATRVASTTGGGPIYFQNGVLASTTLIADNATTTNATTTNLDVSGYTRLGNITGLALTTSGVVSAYGGASACTNQVVTAISASGATTCTTVGNSYLTNSSLTVTAGTGLSGGGSISLGSSATVALLSYLSTSTAETATYVPVWTTTNHTPAQLSGGDAALVHLASASTGIGSTTPWAMLSISTSTGNVLGLPLLAIASSSNQTLLETTAGGETKSCETIYGDTNQPATSTNMVVDWKNTCNHVLIWMNTSAFTLTFINATTSDMDASSKIIRICNPPSGTVGAVTWKGVEWDGGTVPTQTTTAAQCDAWPFDVTAASSTPNSHSYKIDGHAIGAGFQ
jgi:hypothetical protein